MNKKFAHLVKNKFLFLILKYDFKIVFLTDSLVRFENKNIFVVVYFDSKRSYEICVEIGQLGVMYNQQERPFNLYEIVELKNLQEKGKYRLFQASNPAALEACIDHLALLLSTYAAEFLQNDQLAFNKLSEFRERECNKYQLEKSLNQIREEARIAWKNKEYLKFVELYEPMNAAASLSEKKKIEFAKRKIKG